MKPVLTLLLLCFSIFIHAQRQGQSLIDSLVAEVENEPLDSNKVKLLVTIGLKYAESNPDKAIAYSITGLAIAQKIHFKKGIAQLYLTIGNGYNYKGEYKKALLFLDSSLTVQKEINNKKGIALAEMTIATIYQQQSDFTKAADMYFKAFKTAEGLNDSALLGRVSFNIGALYTAQNNNGKAMEYHKKALVFFEAKKAEDLVAIALTSIGSDYINQSQYSEAVAYYTRSMQLSKQLGNNRQLAIVYDCFGNLYNRQSKQDSALAYLLSAGKLWQTIAPQSQNAIVNLGNTGGAYLDIAIKDSLRNLYKHNPAFTRPALLLKAETYTLAAIDVAKQIGDQVYESFYGKILADIYEQKGDYRQAFLNFKMYTKLDDSIHSQESKNAIAELETKREVALRDKEIQLGQFALSARNKERLALMAGIILLTIVLALLYWQNRTRKKTNTTLLQLNNELDEANKIKARFFAILSHDFRGPLSRLVHFLHLQKEDANLWTTDQAVLQQKKITVAAESLLENMEDMLAWSKGQMENFKPTIHTVAVKNLFEYLDSFFVTREHVQIIFNDPGSITLNTDENYLQTIMHNLTSNAIKALKQTNNATIIWSARQEGGKVLLSITDNGPGINAEQVKVLNDDTASLSIKTGLGFHLIRDLAKAIRCRVYLQPKEGQGTSFILSI